MGICNINHKRTISMLDNSCYSLFSYNHLLIKCNKPEARVQKRKVLSVLLITMNLEPWISIQSSGFYQGDTVHRMNEEKRCCTASDGVKCVELDCLVFLYQDCNLLGMTSKLRHILIPIVITRRWSVSHASCFAVIIICHNWFEHISRNFIYTMVLF